jgi:hypothetical protein
VKVLQDAARGLFPPADGSLQVLPPPPGPAMAVVGFSAHSIVASSATDEWVRKQLADGSLAAPMSPRFLTALAHHLGRIDDGVDVVLAAAGLPGTPALLDAELEAHPRVARAEHHREGVRAFEDPRGRGVVIVGQGLARRMEVAVEVAEAHRGGEMARTLLMEARRLVSPDEVVFAQTAPAHAASLRALLAAGFRPIGSEVRFVAGGPVRGVSRC